MYRDGDRHTWRGFLGLIDDEIKAICRSRAVLLRVRAPFRLWIVGENKREHMHVHTRKYTVRSSSMSISFANSFFFSHIETLYTYQENLCTPFLLLFLMIFCRIFFRTRNQKIVARKIIVLFVGDIAAKFNVAESNVLLHNLTASILFEREYDYCSFQIFYIILLHPHIYKYSRTFDSWYLVRNQAVRTGRIL